MPALPEVSECREWTWRSALKRSVTPSLYRMARAQRCGPRARRRRGRLRGLCLSARDAATVSAMETAHHAVLTAVGADRPGLVDAVTRYVTERGGNLEDSRMVNLHGQFAMMLLVAGSEEAMSRLQAGLGALRRDAACTRSCGRRTPGRRSAPRRSPSLTTWAMDHPGLMQSVSHLLGELGVNIESADTSLRPAPYTGTPLFNMQLVVSVPATTHGRRAARGSSAGSATSSTSTGSSRRSERAPRRRPSLPAAASRPSAVRRRVSAAASRRAASSVANSGQGAGRSRSSATTPAPSSVSSPMSAAGMPAASQRAGERRPRRPVAADQQAAGGDEPERVGAEQRADARASRASTGTRSRCTTDAVPGGRGQLPQGGGQAALGDVVHGAHAGEAGGEARLRHDARALRSARQAAELGLAHAERAAGARRARRRAGPCPPSASALVSITRSPGRAERLSRSSARRTVPSAVSETTGRVTASVTSVCPPTSVTPARGGGRRPGRRSSASASDGVVPGGQQHRRQQPARLRSDGGDVVGVDEHGGAPRRRAPPSVMGSPCATSSSAPARSRAATSSPTPGGTSTAGSAPARPPRNPASRSLGSLPGASGRPSRTTSSSSARRPTTKSQSAASGSAPSPLEARRAVVARGRR